MEQQKDCKIKESESQCEKALALFLPWGRCFPAFLLSHVAPYIENLIQKVAGNIRKR